MESDKIKSSMSLAGLPGRKSAGEATFHCALSNGDRNLRTTLNQSSWAWIKQQ